MKIETEEQAKDILSKIRWEHSSENKRIAFQCLEFALRIKSKSIEDLARINYFGHLIFLNEIDEALIQYGWMLNRLKETREIGEDFNTFSVVWNFKWVIHQIPTFASFPLDKVEATLQQFKALYAEYNGGEKVIHYFEMQLRLFLGDRKKSLEEYEKYQSPTISTSIYDDCSVCQKDALIEYFNHLGFYEKSRSFNSEVGAENFTCSEVPQITFPKMCFANLMCGDFTSAAVFYKQTIDQLTLKDAHIDLYYYILYYLGISQDHQGGIAVLEAQLEACFKTSADYRKMNFYHAGFHMCSEWTKQGLQSVPFHLESNDFVQLDNGKLDIRKAKEWFETNFRLHLNRLNTRNGNNYWSEHFIELEKQLITIADRFAQM